MGLVNSMQENKTVLFVDDELNILNALKRQMMMHDFNVLTADSGLKGLEILKENDVSVVVSDQRMPQMPGSKFLAEVKTLYPNCIRIIMSGYSDFVALQDALNEGEIYKFILKPWDEEKLVQELNHCFKRFNNNQYNKVKSQAFDNAMEALVLTTPEYTILSVNTTFCLLTGLTKEDVLGKNIFRYLDNIQIGDLKEEIENGLTDSQYWEGDTSILTKREDPVSIKLSVSNATCSELKQAHLAFSFIEQTNTHVVENEILEKGRRDPNTNLLNRQGLEGVLDSLLYDKNLNSKLYCVMAVCFLNFNHQLSSLGEGTVKELLFAIISRLENFKSLEIGRGTDNCFILVFNEKIILNGLMGLLNDIKTQFKEPLVLATEQIFLKPCIGASFFPNDALNGKQLLEKAIFSAEYGAAHHLGESIYCKEIESKAKKSIQEESKIYQLVRNEKFDVCFNSQYFLSSKEFAGFESVVCLKDEESGECKVQDFVQKAEKINLIEEFEEKVILKSFEILAGLSKEQNFTPRLCLNISSSHFMKIGFAEFLNEKIEQAHLDPKRITLFVKEGSWLERVDEVNVVINELKRIGVRIGLSDFGNGYTCISYISKFQLDFIKFNPLIIHGACKLDSFKNILIHLTQICHSFGFKTIIDGIEDKKHLELVESLPCDIVQGDFISQPCHTFKFETLNEIGHAKFK